MGLKNCIKITSRQEQGFGIGEREEIFWQMTRNKSAGVEGRFFFFFFVQNQLLRKGFDVLTDLIKLGSPPDSGGMRRDLYRALGENFAGSILCHHSVLCNSVIVGSVIRGDGRLIKEIDLKTASFLRLDSIMMLSKERLNAIAPQLFIS